MSLILAVEHAIRSRDPALIKEAKIRSEIQLQKGNLQYDVYLKVQKMLDEVIPYEE